MYRKIVIFSTFLFDYAYNCKDPGIILAGFLLTTHKKSIMQSISSMDTTGNISANIKWPANEVNLKILAKGMPM